MCVSYIIIIKIIQFLTNNVFFAEARFKGDRKKVLKYIVLVQIMIRVTYKTLYLYPQ